MARRFAALNYDVLLSRDPYELHAYQWIITWLSRDPYEVLRGSHKYSALIVRNIPLIIRNDPLISHNNSH